LTTKLKSKKFFVVRKLNKKASYYEDISLIDSSGSFRGIAKFETLQDAKSYLELYKKRINDRLNAVGKARTRGLKYEIFELDGNTMNNDRKHKYRFLPDSSISPLS
jgi:hypothetical protein